MKIKPIIQKSLAKLTKPIKIPIYGKVAVAVSGGCDSVALLVLLKEWCRMKGLSLCVFHVDHQMRENSSKDADWVKQLASEWGLEFYSRKATPKDKASNLKLGQEGWARNFRYSAFAQMLSESNADIIATGHNADDQAETILMRLLRGCSFHGLHGIRATKTLNFAQTKIRVWRPILKISRKELEKMLISLNQSWCEDETNATTIYLRNKIRHDLIPALEAIQANAISHIIALAEDTKKMQAYLNRKARKYLTEYAGDNQLAVHKTLISPLRREILRIWLVELGMTNVLTRPLIDRLDELWVAGVNNKSLCHRGFKIVWRKKNLLFEKLFEA